MVCEYNSNILTAVLLTWSDLEEDFNEGGDGYDDAGAN
jgi:hypothetical protein